MSKTSKKLVNLPPAYLIALVKTLEPLAREASGSLEPGNYHVSGSIELETVLTKGANFEQALPHVLCPLKILTAILAEVSKKHRTAFLKRIVTNALALAEVPEEIKAEVKTLTRKETTTAMNGRVAVVQSKINLKK